MMNRTQTKLISILMQTAWVLVGLMGVILIVIAFRGFGLPLENAIYFTTGIVPRTFLMIVGWVFSVMGIVAAVWWYYEHYYSHTIYVRTPYGELEIHKAAIRGYLEQQLGLIAEVVSHNVSVAIHKRRFVSLDIHVVVNHNKSCREYGEKLQQDILQMLLSTFAIKDIRRLHIQVDAFYGGESKTLITYR